MLPRTPLRQIVTEPLRTVPDLTVGEPGTPASNVVHTVKTMPCSLGG